MAELDSGGNLVATNVFAPDGLVARGTSSGWTQYEFDPEGSVSLRMDASGSVLTARAYDAYGGDSAYGATVGDASPDPYGYHARDGYYTDRETGLVYCRHRYYDPATGRWVTRDPIGAADGINVYAYCASGPVGRSDPSGLQAEDEKESRGGGARPFFDPQDPDDDGSEYPWKDPDYRPDGDSPDETIAEPVEPPMPGPPLPPEVEQAVTDGLVTNTQITECEWGSYSIWDWSGYPDDVEKPEGPFRDRDENDQKAARIRANNRNRSLRRFLGIKGNRQVEIHEIKPVKQGGSPTDIRNKMLIDENSHDEITQWWNRLGRGP